MIDQEDYTKEWGAFCPFCESSNTLAFGAEYVDKFCYVPRECQECGAEWRDVFLLIGFNV